MPLLGRNGRTRPNPLDGFVCPVPPTRRPVGDVGQAGVAVRDPWGALNAMRAKDDALAQAKKAFPRFKGIDDKRDAFRHFYWVSTMTRDLGADRARKFANSHEAEYPLKTQADARSRQMDTFNNEVAISMATDPRLQHLSPGALSRFAIARNCLGILKR